jgi:broad specificity phosphatase PhoE
VSGATISPIGGSSSPDNVPLVVYTSTLPRAIQTAALLKDRSYSFEAQSALNMMDTGVCSGMNIEEIRRQMPEELSKWQKHKFRYRFPGGESQADRARSLEPLVFELERQTLPVLVVSHMSTLQVLLGYFYGSKRSVDSYYSLWIPQHTVLEIIPSQYGYTSCSYDLSEEACREAEEEAAAMQVAEEGAAAGGESGHAAAGGAGGGDGGGAGAAPSGHVGVGGGFGGVAGSAAALAASPTRSPRYNAPLVQQRDLGAQSADEVERFNLQVVPSMRTASAATTTATKPATTTVACHNNTNNPKARAQAKAAELAGMAPQFSLGGAALAQHAKAIVEAAAPQPATAPASSPPRNANVAAAHESGLSVPLQNDVASATAPAIAAAVAAAAAAASSLAVSPRLTFAASPRMSPTVAGSGVPSLSSSPVNSGASAAGGSLSVPVHMLPSPMLSASPLSSDGSVASASAPSSVRKGSAGFLAKPIGKASPVTVLGETNFYAGPHGGKEG